VNFKEVHIHDLQALSLHTCC